MVKTRVRESSQEIKIALIISIVSLLISFASFAINTIPQSPKVYFYTNLSEENGFCVPELDKIEQTVTFQFMNIGKTPTNIKFHITGKNLVIRDGEDTLNTFDKETLERT